MENLKLKISDTPILTKDEINQIVLEIAQDINADFQDKPNPLIVAVMDGSLMFAADLMKSLPDKFELISINVKSYENVENLNNFVVFRVPSQLLFEDRDIIIIDTIFDTGQTAKKIFEFFKDQCKTKSLSFYILINKVPTSVQAIPCSRALIFDKIKDGCYRARIKKAVITDKFLVGYGLDYNGKYRGLSDIHTIEEQEKKVEIKVRDHCTRLQEIATEFEKYQAEIESIRQIYYDLRLHFTNKQRSTHNNIHSDLSYAKANLESVMNNIQGVVDDIETLEF